MAGTDHLTTDILIVGGGSAGGSPSPMLPRLPLGPLFDISRLRSEIPST
jgi:hypothetical protein